MNKIYFIEGLTNNNIWLCYDVYCIRMDNFQLTTLNNVFSLYGYVEIDSMYNYKYYKKFLDKYNTLYLKEVKTYISIRDEKIDIVYNKVKKLWMLEKIKRI